MGPAGARWLIVGSPLADLPAAHGACCLPLRGVLLQVRERSSKSQQLKLDTMFKEVAARAAAVKEEQRQAAIAAGELDPAAGSSDDEDADNPAAAGSEDEDEKLMRDMEDLIGGGAAAPDQAKAAQQQRQHRGRGRVITEDDQPAAAAGARPAGDAGKDAMQIDQQQQQQQPAPDRVSDYAAWVKWQKQRWRAGRQESKRRKLEAAKRSAAADQQAPQVGTSLLRAMLGVWAVLQQLMAAASGSKRKLLSIGLAASCIPPSVA
jgi:hypothetical protein